MGGNDKPGYWKTRSDRDCTLMNLGQPESGSWQDGRLGRSTTFAVFIVVSGVFAFQSGRQFSHHFEDADGGVFLG